MGLKKSIHHLHVIIKLTIISLPKMKASCRGNFLQADPSPDPFPLKNGRGTAQFTPDIDCIVLAMKHIIYP